MISAVPTFSLLIVDDNDFQLRLAIPSLQKVFESNHFSYSIMQASDGVSAWDICREKKFDLYVIDYQMPGMNGVELCRLILQKQNAKIVLYTSEEPEGIVQIKKDIDPKVDIIPKDVTVLKVYVNQYIQTPSIAKQFVNEEDSK